MVQPIIFGLLPLIASHGLMITQERNGFCFFPITTQPTNLPTAQPTILIEPTLKFLNDSQIVANKNETTQTTPPEQEKEKTGIRSSTLMDGGR